MFTTNDTYLESQVMSASPQRLRLMLIEGAIRFTRQAIHHWQAQRLMEGAAALERARDVVVELMTKMDREREPALTERVAAMYAWVFRAMTDANWAHDPNKLEQVLGVLEIDADTWRSVCEKLAGADPFEDPNYRPPRPVAPIPAPHGMTNWTTPLGSEGSLNLDA